MEFSELSLHQDLQRGIAEAGYVTCMPVQEQVLANAFSGQDLYVQSQTGTGKTAAFLAVIFQRLLTEDLLAGKKAIIMVPTRELAVQVEEEAKVLGKYLPFKIGSFYGGVGYTQQEKMLRENVQILVGTPGRVLDLNSSGKMNLMDIAFLVLDEADRMFDMGFYPDLRKLIRVVPPADRRQTMLFSATLNAWVKNLAWEYTKKPFEIEIEPETVTVQEVEQILYHVPSEDKMRLLLGILEHEKPESAIIFCNTKRYTEIIAKRLRVNGYECEFIIGDLPQAKRLKVIDDVKAGNVHFLVATDVAARGLDIDNLSMVINYDLPVEAENYVHRIGRTARAGKTGRAFTLASEQDVYELPDIEKYIGKKIPSEIASEILYAEDKSAGMRIHTDFFGSNRDDGGRGGRSDGRGSRGGRDDGRREGGFSRERSREGGREASRDNNRPARSDGSRSDQNRSRRDRPQNPAAQPNGQYESINARPSPGGEDISKLPFDQRMAYYKQKYVAPGGEGTDNEAQETRAAQSGPAQGPANNRGGKSRRKAPAGRDNNTPRDNAGPRPQSRRRRPDQSQNRQPGASGQPGQNPAGGPARAQGAPSQNGPAPGTAKKPGLVGKLLGIFKRKK